MGSRTGNAGTSSSGVGGIRLIRGCIDLGRSTSSEYGSSTSVLNPNPEVLRLGDSPRSDAESWDIERKYSERPWTIRGLSTVKGGSRLTLLPSLLLSCNCRARSRLCMAKASNGDSSGGISPATWRRGDRRGREFDERFEYCDSDLKSRKPGRFVMIRCLVL